MTSIATHATDDVGGEVSLLGAVVLAMSNFATVLASLVLVVAKGSVEGGQFAELVSFESVLALGNRSSLKIAVSGRF